MPENPWNTLLYWLPGTLAFAAGLLPLRPRPLPFLHAALLLTSTVVYWCVLQHSVAWAYDHPVNPSDGAPKIFALFFGWLTGLIFPILPAWIAARFLIRVIHPSVDRRQECTRID